MGIIPADLVVPLASILGLGFLGVVAAFGQWWGRRVPTAAERTIEVAGALVDSGAVKMLSAALEAHTLELITHRHEAEKAREIGYRLIKALESIADELGELRRAAGDLAKEVARK